jgi:hypothetical protein
MRPQSQCRVETAAALLDGPGTSKELAQRTGWSIGATREALHSMVRAGDARVSQQIRVKGVKRPVPVYVKCVRVLDVATSRSASFAMLQAWATWPARTGARA